MGYFDALTSSCFKITPDGRKLFFPWGILGRGYVIPSEQHYDRLRRQIKTSMIVTTALLGTAAASQYYLASFLLAAALIGLYLIWLPFLLRRLQPSDERLSYEESLTSQARAHTVGFLWLGEVMAVVFLVVGIGLLIVSPQNWLIALALIVFSGFGLVVFARMLLLRE